MKDTRMQAALRYLPLALLLCAFPAGPAAFHAVVEDFERPPDMAVYHWKGPDDLSARVSAYRPAAGRDALPGRLPHSGIRANGGDRKGWIQIADGIGQSKDPRRFSFVVFAAAKPRWHPHHSGAAKLTSSTGCAGSPGAGLRPALSIHGTM